MSNGLYATIMLFTVAHEAAHHVLNHFDNHNKQSKTSEDLLAQSRKNEEAAAMLQEASALLEQGKSEDPSNAKVSQVWKKLERIQKTVARHAIPVWLPITLQPFAVRPMQVLLSIPPPSSRERKALLTIMTSMELTPMETALPTAFRVFPKGCQSTRPQA